MRSERCVIQAPRPFRVGKQVRLYRSHSRRWRWCSYRTILLYYKLFMQREGRVSAIGSLGLILRRPEEEVFTHQLPS